MGLVLDSSVLVAAERSKLRSPDIVRDIRERVGDIPIVICSLTVAELAHGIYRATTEERRTHRRQFLDEIKVWLPVYPFTSGAAEIVGRVDGEQAAKGINLPIADLIIGACAMELGYAVGTHNVRDFERIPGLSVVRL